MMGWGFDVSYPNYKWHAKKNYAENFKYKGEPVAEVVYDWVALHHKKYLKPF